MKKMYSTGPFFFVLCKAALNVLLVKLDNEKSFLPINPWLWCFFLLVSIQFISKCQGGKIRKKQRRQSKLVSCIGYVTQRQMNQATFHMVAGEGVQNYTENN